LLCKTAESRRLLSLRLVCSPLRLNPSNQTNIYVPCPRDNFVALNRFGGNSRAKRRKISDTISTNKNLWQVNAKDFFQRGAAARQADLVEELHGYSPGYSRMNHASGFWKASLVRGLTIVEKIRNYSL